MSRFDYRDYFVHPVEPSHRRYEALRSVLVDERPMKQVAQRFEVSYGTIRNWVSEFCRGQDTGQSPPFSPRPRADVPRPTKPIATTRIPRFKSPMFRRCRWKRDVG